GTGPADDSKINGPREPPRSGDGGAEATPHRGSASSRPDAGPRTPGPDSKGAHPRRKPINDLGAAPRTPGRGPPKASLSRTGRGRLRVRSTGEAGPSRRRARPSFGMARPAPADGPVGRLRLRPA